METCAICGSVNPTERIVDYQTQYRGNDGVIRDLLVPNLRVIYCEACHEEMLDHEAVARIEAAQRQAIGRLSPDELRVWRESLSKSQTEVARILGFGKKTFARWETGAYTLTAAADRYIRLLMAKPEGFEYVQRLADDADGIILSGSEDDLAHYNFDVLTEEFKAVFGDDDPAIRNSEVFSLDLSQGRVFGL